MPHVLHVSADGRIFGLEFGEEVSVCSFGQLHETARRHHGRERYDDASCQVDQGLIR